MKKNIVLGVTGSIAAHRAADLASLLTKQGCEVRVVMTADAQRFITPLPFKTLSRNPVVTDLYDEQEGWKPTHIKLADEANLLLIAPATANVIAKMANGIAANHPDIFSKYAVMADWLKNNQISVSGRISEAATYHDPCVLARFFEDTDSPRFLLSQILDPFLCGSH